MVKIQESAGRHFVTIPKEIMMRKKWKKGDRVLWSYNDRGCPELQEIEEVKV